MNDCKIPEKLLVLLAGQSNMDGRSYAGADDLVEIANLQMIRPDGKWQPEIEPITNDRPFVGTFTAAAGHLPGTKGTFHGHNPANTKLHHRPIDFILVNKDVKVIIFQVLNDLVNSLHARNHYSLNAVIGL